MTRPVTMRFAGRPPLLNAERAGHWRDHRAATRFLRTEACLRGRGVRRLRPGTFFEEVEVRSWPTYPTRGSWPDVGAWMPGVKAVVDGLVDAGVLPNDTAAVVRRMVFDAPRVGERAELVVVLVPWDRSDGYQRIDGGGEEE